MGDGEEDRELAPGVWQRDGVCDGEPTIGRTRVRVLLLGDLDGEPVEKIVELFPVLDPEEVRLARQWWRGVSWARETSEAERTIANLRRVLAEHDPRGRGRR